VTTSESEQKWNTESQHTWLRETEIVHLELGTCMEYRIYSEHLASVVSEVHLVHATVTWTCWFTCNQQNCAFGTGHLDCFRTDPTESYCQAVPKISLKPYKLYLFTQCGQFWSLTSKTKLVSLHCILLALL
jgi:hypothetical protein